jgi:transcriptional regulator GlxA family with amidase domain
VRTAFVLYDQMTALDIVGPYEVLAGHPAVAAHYVAAEVGPIRCDNGLVLHADATFEQLPDPDLVVVPGSSRWRAALEDQQLIDWLAAAQSTASHIISVCTGSTLLGQAGLLTGRRATSHWVTRDSLTTYGAIATAERVVVDGNVITGAGVSAGIDMALVLAAQLWGETVAGTIQLALEYDPQPPFDSGSPEKAAPAVVDAIRTLLGGAA